MKANPRPLLVLATMAAALLTASCSERRVVPTPLPSPTPTPAPAPAPTPANWQDVPATPGTWTWRAGGGRSVASFADGKLTMTCDPATRTITLARPGSAPADARVPMTILTQTSSRVLTATAQGQPATAIAASLPARDPLLDAMAFTRGRFAVETAGLLTLYVPSWAEVSRVIEDCR